MDDKLASVLRLLAEKLDLSPAEFAEATIVIRNGEVESVETSEVAIELDEIGDFDASE